MRAVSRNYSKSELLALRIYYFLAFIFYCVPHFSLCFSYYPPQSLNFPRSQSSPSEYSPQHKKSFIFFMRRVIYFLQQFFQMLVQKLQVKPLCKRTVSPFQLRKFVKHNCNCMGNIHNWVYFRGWNRNEHIKAFELIVPETAVFTPEENRNCPAIPF